MKISPKYRIGLIDKIHGCLYDLFVSYQKVELYLRQWQELVSFCEYGEDDIYNFSIFRRNDNPTNIDSFKTLHDIDDDTLLKIAVDLGIETPFFIPSIPLIKNKFKESYETAFGSFENAVKNIEDDPGSAITLANSTLESIIKSILKKLDIRFNKKHTLYKLGTDLLKEFKIFPKSNMPVEIKKIGSNILSLLQSIEEVRSNKTYSHGKTEDDYLINESLYAYFIVNLSATLGLFFSNFYETKYTPLSNPKEEVVIPDEMPF